MGNTVKMEAKPIIRHFVSAGLALPPEQWQLMIKQIEEDTKKLKQKFCGILESKGVKRLLDVYLSYVSFFMMH